TLLPSVADPHWMPPSAPPSPTLASHSGSPRASGSTAYSIPDFWPNNKARLPDGSDTRIGEDPKSKSGPTGAGQFGFPGTAHAMLYVSALVNCFDQSSLPVSRSSASRASLVSVGGSE